MARSRPEVGGKVVQALVAPSPGRPVFLAWTFLPGSECGLACSHTSGRKTHLPQELQLPSGICGRPFLSALSRSPSEFRFQFLLICILSTVYIFQPPLPDTELRTGGV